MKKIFLCLLSFIFAANSFVFAGDEGGKAARLEPIVVTPWRVEELAANVSKNVSIITSEDIKRTDATYLYELLKSKPGVIVSNQLGNPKGQVVDIRGFGESSTSNVLVLLDGRRTNQIDLSGVDWGQIDVKSIERIEIARGPATVLYGDNASGGVINIITKKGAGKKPAASSGVEIGSYQYHKEFGTVSGASKKYDYFFSSSHTQTSGYRANNYYWASDYFARATIYPSDEFNIDFSSGYHRDHYGLPGALYLAGNPNAITPAGVEQLGRKGTVFPDDNGRTGDFFTSIEPKFTFRLGGHDIAAKIFGSFRSRRNKAVTVPEPTNWFPSHMEFETVHHIKSYDLRPKLEFDSDFLGTKALNKLTIGSDFFYAKDQVLSGNRLTGQDETMVIKQTFGIYMHDNIRLWDNLLANAGARGEWADFDFEQFRLVPTIASRDLKEAAYEIGLGYKYNDISQIYANFSRSFRFPNTEEYYQNRTVFFGTIYGGLNESIKHQVAHTFEAGIKDATFPWMKVNADYYWMGIKNEIYLDPASFQNSNYRPMTIHQGFEIESFFNFFNELLNPYVNYTLQEAYFKGGIYANEQIPLVPKNKISAGILLKPLKGLEISGGFNFAGSRFMVSDQKNIASKLKAYKTFDTKLSYEWKNIRAFFAINNLFNENYYAYGVTNSAGTAETFYPAPERSFEAGATVTF